jgi:hypothetical protein
VVTLFFGCLADLHFPADHHLAPIFRKSIQYNTRYIPIVTRNRTRALTPVQYFTLLNELLNPSKSQLDSPIFGVTALLQGPFIIKKHPTSSSRFGRGETFTVQFEKVRFAEMRKEHLYYPLASRDEWKLAAFLLHSRLSMVAMDRFLNLKLVSYNPKCGVYLILATGFFRIAMPFIPIVKCTGCRSASSPDSVTYRG